MELKQYILLRASKKTGKIDTTMDAIGKGLLSMWALQNTPKGKESYIIERESGEIISIYSGTGGFPDIEKGCCGFIDSDLLEALKKEIPSRI